VGTGLLDGNAVHETFMEIAAKVQPSFAINTTVDDRGEAVDVHCGHWIDAHRSACQDFALSQTVQIGEKRDVVVASCGGWPYDINMIQAHKALEAASHGCTEGGTIILLAECADGLGRDDFLDWFAAADSDALAHRLCEKYQVNGQTAWSLLRKAERFDIAVVTELDDAVCSMMRLRKVGPDDISAMMKSCSRGYILESGAKVMVRLSQ